MGKAVATCPACGSEETTIAAEIPGIPVHVGVLWPTTDSAKGCPRGDMRLVFCRACGFLHNAAFDEGLVDYGLSYDNALHHSGVFKDYELALANRLIDRYDVRGKVIVEIGCGSAHFLGLLCQLGDNRGFGFDPSHEPEFLDELAVGRVEVKRAYYDETTADIGADLVCARHVLEHVADPRALLSSLRSTLVDRPAVVYFEVPNALLAIEQLSIWDLMYEHCGYYTAGSLRRLFRSTGFDVLHTEEAYGGQFVGIEAQPGSASRSTMDESEAARMESLVAAFAREVDERRDHWNDRLRSLRESDARVVVWGAGGKGVSFMNFVPAADSVHALVDVNPRKQGTFLAGSGHEIIPPQALTETEPDVIIVMNPLYEQEILEHVRSLGLDRTRVESVT